MNAIAANGIAKERTYKMRARRTPRLKSVRV